MRKIIGTLFTIALVMGSASCSGDDNPGPTGNQNTSTISMTIEGAAFTPTVVLAARSGNTASITTTDAAGKQVTITINTGNSAGTFTVSSGSAAVQLIVGSQAWVGHLTGASGSVILSSLSATTMIGTFDITLTAQTPTGATGTRRLVGSFTGVFGQT